MVGHVHYNQDKLRYEIFGQDQHGDYSMMAVIEDYLISRANIETGESWVNIVCRVAAKSGFDYISFSPQERLVDLMPFKAVQPRGIGRVVVETAGDNQ